MGAITVQAVNNVERPKNAVFGLFDAPPVKDWIVWLFTVAVIAGISSTVGNYQQPVLVGGVPVPGETEFSIRGQELAFVIDCLIFGGIQFLLFGVLPAAFRKSLRQRRAT